MAQERNHQNNKFINIGSIGRGLLVSSICLVGIAAILAYLPKKINLQNNSYWTNLFYNLSSAFAASAVLTLTLEFANNYQRNKDLNEAIDEMQRATTDSILEEMIGDKLILEEVKTHILKQNLIRKNFRIVISLSQDTGPYNFLMRDLLSSYSIYNLTSQVVVYSFKILETKENEFLRPGSTAIKNASYYIKDSQGKTFKSRTYNESEIKGLAEISDALLKFEEQVEIPPRCYGEFKFSSQSLLRPDVIDPIVTLVSTTDMEIDLNFPFNTEVDVFGIHPDPKKFEMQLSQNNFKRWRAVGLLPGQGILLSLKSLNSQEIYPKLPPTLEDMMEEVKQGVIGSE
ncbi:hypothetical protein ACQ4N7_28335 [Nodosilinea sp. AN01ver1]|uniref:hypothetical protein n=1 Tax=Nodosilinea sp. AN01ver1 TaxID=3423362 RepID=UPI003D31D677